jgi:hypothetical protein
VIQSHQPPLPGGYRVSVVKSIVYTECGRDQFVTIRSSRSLSELTQHATEICEKPSKHEDSEKIEEREEGLKTRPRAPTNSENGRRERTSPETRNICFRAARTPSGEPCRFSYLQRQLGREFRAAGPSFPGPFMPTTIPVGQGMGNPVSFPLSRRSRTAWNRRK